MVKKRRIYIEASSIAEDRISGIGHNTVELIRALERNPECNVSFTIILLAGFDKIDQLNKWHFTKVQYKKIPCFQRIFNLLWKYHLLPPMDIILGKGVYIFPNFKNWQLLFSKSITYIHDIGFELFPEFVSPKNQIFLAKNIRKWLKRTDVVATISESAKKEIINFYGISDDKIIVLLCGVDSSVFYPRTKHEIVTTNQKYNIPKEYILYLGNIEPRKNIVRLLDAYNDLPTELKKKYSLVLIGGSGWLNEPIIQTVNSYIEQGINIVMPSDYVPDDDLPAIESGATLLVLPSLYEGFGLSLVQAMSCGTPVIAANNSSMPEIVGAAGLLVDAKSTPDIRNKLENLLEDAKLRKLLSDKGILRAKKFNWDDSIEKLVHCIDNNL